jgi:hypothetical protein
VERKGKEKKKRNRKENEGGDKEKVMEEGWKRT